MESQSQFSDPAAFLRLTPANLYAKIAFNDVVLLMNASRSNAHLQHARKFMEVQPYQHEVEISSQPVHEVENFSQSDVDSDVSGSREPVIEYQGSYVLSFDVRPGLPQVGWIVGTGRWNLQKMETIPNSGADIQLAPPGPQFSKYGVAGKHAILYFDGNGTMSVRIVNSRRPKVMIDTEEFDDGSRGLTSRRHLISFGKLSYDMELVTLDEEKYQRNLRIYFTHYLRRPVPPPDISATPSPWDLIFNNWIVKGTVGKGAFGSVNAAKHRLSGETAAAKCLVRNTKTWPRAAAEIDILKVLPRHERLLRICHVEYERGERWLTGPQDEEDERHGFSARPERIILIFQPYARFNLQEYQDRLPLNMRLLAFQQILDGLKVLHSNGFIHRDIKPANIGIVSLSPDINIETVILDYGQTVYASTCNHAQGVAGTPSYRAPEMEDQDYGSAVDIWACGIIGLQLFVVDKRMSWVKATDEKDSIVREVALLGQEPAASPKQLLSQLLAWDPAERISADQALSHSCFSSLPISDRDSGSLAARAGHKRSLE